MIQGTSKIIRRELIGRIPDQYIYLSVMYADTHYCSDYNIFDEERRRGKHDRRNAGIRLVLNIDVYSRVAGSLLHVLHNN